MGLSEPGPAAQAAPTPSNEAVRLALLRDLDILDTAPEERFDRVTRLASAILDAPIALVSLVDHDRQWFKARTGLEATQTAREVAFCAHAILDDGVMVVPDAREDPRFAHNPLVTGDLGIRFYAGAPLILQPHVRLGTLCVIDRVPRELDPTQRQLLADLAAVVVDELALRRQLAYLVEAHATIEAYTDEVAREARAIAAVAASGGGAFLELQRRAETLAARVRAATPARPRRD